MKIPVLADGVGMPAVTSALDEAGAVVVTGVLDPGQRGRVVAELGDHVASARFIVDDDPDKFYPGRTRRVPAAFTRSQGVRELVRHRLLMDACDQYLLPNCERYQLHVSTALVIGPGARAQMLHREDDSYPFFAPPRPHLVLASMWAMTPFTADNGATLIVPGSHRWEGDRTARRHEIVPAEMPVGAVLLWLGGTLHGAGANRTVDDQRYGVFVSFSLGWLRQEENQYLDVPPEVAATLDNELKSLVGYEMHGALGFHDPGPLT